MTTNTVCYVSIINGDAVEGKIDVSKVLGDGPVEPTNRVLEGYIKDEYQQRGTMPDGRDCLKIYQFLPSEIREAHKAGDPCLLWEDFLPWDDEHIAQIEIL